jgi:hypothetical protein
MTGVARRPVRGGRRARPLRSHPRARAGVRGHVSSRGFAKRDAREGDVQDIVLCAVVDDLIHFAGSLGESLPRAVRRSLALAANRSVNGERTLFDDDDRASRMGMPPRVATRFDRDLHHHYIRSALKRDGPIGDVSSTRQGDVHQPRRWGGTHPDHRHAGECHNGHREYRLSKLALHILLLRRNSDQPTAMAARIDDDSPKGQCNVGEI